MRSTPIVCAAAIACAASAHANPFATSVLSYDQGADPIAGFTDANAALGAAERFTGEGQFPSGVTPFNPAFGTDELVSIGAGGHLTLGFDTLITNNPAHAYGVDLIVFSNSGFADASWSDADPDNDGTGITGPNPFIFGIGGEATVQVSQNGTDWVTAAITALDLFPTLGYSDFMCPTPDSIGQVETDFTRAMDPSLTVNDFANLSFAELIAVYNGSGGGIGIDIASTGLESAGFVRLLNNSGEAFEIDAVAVVPAPGVLALVSMGGLAAVRRRRA